MCSSDLLNLCMDIGVPNLPVRATCPRRLPPISLVTQSHVNLLFSRFAEGLGVASRNKSAQKETLAKREGLFPLGCLKATSAFADHLARGGRLVPLSGSGC